jgi:hypothetical protein
MFRVPELGEVDVDGTVVVVEAIVEVVVVPRVVEVALGLVVAEVIEVVGLDIG